MEHRNQWKQVSLKALEFFTEIETNNNSDPIMTKKKEQCKQYKKKQTKEQDPTKLYTILYHKYEKTTRKRKREIKK